MKKFTAIILAGGKGKRLKSSQPKVLQTLCGEPLIFYLITELLKLKTLGQIIIVVGHKSQAIKTAVKKNFPRLKIEFVTQAKALGTANAVEVALEKIRYKNILVVCGDAPLVTSKTLSKFCANFLRKGLACSLISATLNQKNSLGVILRNQKGKLKSIKEKISGFDSGSPREVNSGIYCFEKKVLINNLAKITKNKKKKEYFLTDIVGILCEQGYKIAADCLADPEEILGINSPLDLMAAEGIMRQRLLNKHILSGVRIIDPNTTFIQAGVKIGKETIIYPFTFISKGVIIGRNCSLGPFVHLRGNTRIADKTCLGSFLELNRTKVAKHAKIKHFGYLGDAIVDQGANIGAGTVTANFDGKAKHKTRIGQGAFIGSDTILVAPVRVGKNAITGAGSVVTRNVKDKTIVVGVPARPFKKKRG